MAPSSGELGKHDLNDKLSIKKKDKPLKTFGNKESCINSLFWKAVNSFIKLQNIPHKKYNSKLGFQIDLEYF